MIKRTHSIVIQTDPKSCKIILESSIHSTKGKAKTREAKKEMHHSKFKPSHRPSPQSSRLAREGIDSPFPECVIHSTRISTYSS